MDQPKTADVVIIGGGVMGVSTAYHLLKKQPGLRVVLLERGPFLGGAPPARPREGSGTSSPRRSTSASPS